MNCATNPVSDVLLYGRSGRIVPVGELFIELFAASQALFNLRWVVLQFFFSLQRVL